MMAGIADFAKSVRRRLVPRMFRRMARNADGATALEFALIGPAFIALLVGLLQTGMVFFYQQMLQTATTKAARLIMTGQAQTQGLSAAQFVNDICSDAGSLFKCANLSANVQTFTSFSSMSMSSPISNGTFTSTGLTYTPGIAGDIVLVQVFYQMPVSAGPLGFNIASTKNGNAVLVGTSVFRNEPYQ